jgi:hypothetical protein
MEPGRPAWESPDPREGDPLWWVRRYAEREGLDLSLALPAPLQLRKEAASLPQSLVELRTEASVA